MTGRFVAIRNRYKDFFNLGEMLPEPQIRSSVGTTNSNWWTMFQNTPVTLDSIQTGAFKYGDRNIVLFVNISDNPISFKYSASSLNFSISDKITLGASEVLVRKF